MTLDELDRLAAEKVMGWEYHTRHHLNRKREGGFAYQSGCYTWKNNGDTYLRDESDWQPTRHIEQAWECLKKFSNETWTWEIYEAYAPRGYFTVIITNLENYMRYESRSSTTEEAIVKACLKAKGVEV